MGFLSDLLDDVVEIPSKAVELVGEVTRIPKKVIDELEETFEDLLDD